MKQKRVRRRVEGRALVRLVQLEGVGRASIYSAEITYWTLPAEELTLGPRTG